MGGDWPDGRKAPQGDVIYVSAEDGVSDTIRPRLDRLGASVSHIHGIPVVVPQGDGSSLVQSLIDHLDAIEVVVRETKAIWMVLDPLLAST